MKHIVYKIKSATIKNIEAHLEKTKDNFVPPLDTTVNLKEYSCKLFQYSQTFEAWNNEELIGLIAAYVNDYETKIAYISNVSVLLEYSGKNIAQKLLENCIEFCKYQQFIEIRLEVNKENLRAIRFYEKNNFIKNSDKNDSIILKIII